MCTTHCINEQILAEKTNFKHIQTCKEDDS